MDAPARYLLKTISPHPARREPGSSNKTEHQRNGAAQWKSMKNSYKDDSFNARMANAAKARQAVLARVKAKPGPGDPEFEKKRAERKAIAEARAIRQAERKAAREAEAARKAAERAAKEAAEREEAERKALEEQELLARQKAARDARYAARKARKGKRR